MADRLNRALLLIFLFSLPAIVFPQDYDNTGWEQLLYESMLNDDIDSEAITALHDQLATLAASPIDLNRATDDELQQLPFLTPQMIDDLIEYRDRYNPIRSVAELLAVRSIDVTTLRLLSFFITADNPPATHQYPFPYSPPKDSLRPAYYRRSSPHSFLCYSFRYPFNERKGDANGYLGYPYKHSLRYRQRIEHRFDIGLTAAQDAGEPFFAGNNKWGYDYYSFFASARNIGPMKNIIAGHYQLSRGMGLIINSSFSLGKLSTLQNLGRSMQTLRANTSSMESSYLQGIAAKASLSSSLSLTAWLSSRQIDASLSADGASITSLSATGYHRSPAEMQRKHCATESMAGIGGDWRYGSLNIGATLLYNQYSLPLAPAGNALYKRYAAKGRRFTNGSLQYSWRNKLIHLSGETATDRNGHLATLNSLTLSPSHELQLMLLQRFYSFHYVATHAQSFSEGGHVQNESGLFLGAKWKPSLHWQLSAYADMAYFPWARYGVSRSSKAADGLVQAVCSYGNHTVSLRLREHLRQKDNTAKTALDSPLEHRLRLAYSWQNTTFATKTQVDAVAINSSSRSKGAMLTQSGSLTTKSLTMTATASIFKTDDYASRLYIYERSPNFQFSVPMVYGSGLRGSLIARYKIGSAWQFTAKYGITHYTDRHTIGSGLQLINGNTQQDLDMQLLWKF